VKAFYNIGYRFFRMPWEGGPRSELVDLVEGRRISPCHAIDLGCGTGANAVFLAQRGFDVTGVDFAPAALDKARAKARAAGVRVNFIIDDLTRLRQVKATFDFLVDYGALDDLNDHDRALYVRSVVPLANIGSRFLLWCFEWPTLWWERFSPWEMAMRPGEVAWRFGRWFDVDRIAGELHPRGWPRGYAAYLMTRVSGRELGAH
jgi:SAM-dependent methyltransferase